MHFSTKATEVGAAVVGVGAAAADAADDDILFRVLSFSNK
jgi:hypothetical protein